MAEILPEYTTYSEEERQEAKINKANAGLLFTPEFIPFYPAVKKQYGLTDKEAILYGFIRFYLTSNERARFYFTNEQLAEILDCDIKTISRAVAKLEDVKIITTSRKIRANGGQIRFISGFTPTGQNVVLQKDKNGMLQRDIHGMLQRDIHGMVINNKLKENNIKKSITDFIPPSFDTIKGYIIANNYTTDPHAFYSYFTEGDWIDSNGKKVKNWKQKLITWESHNKKKEALGGKDGKKDNTMGAAAAFLSLKNNLQEMEKKQ